MRQGAMFADITKPAGRERSVIAAILACGAAARLIWAIGPDQIRPVTTESHNVAAALVATGRFADPFGNGGGLTAHISMLTPLPSAVAYRLFGLDTPMAEFMLSVWATGLVTASLWLLWRLAKLLETPQLARIGAIAFIALVPLQFGLETREGRSWEVNLAVTLLLWILLRLAEADRKADIGGRTLAVTGALAGFLFIVSPPAGFAAAAATVLFHLLRLPWRRWWVAPLGFALVVGLLGGVWAARNISAVGEAVLFRDNFGLELALSNYAGALTPIDPRAAYLARIKDIHPLQQGPANAKLKAAGGEVAYYRKLGHEAERWIATHPRAFLELCARRFVQFYLPPRWFWGTFGGEGHIIPLRQGMAWTTGIAGLVALLLLAWRRRGYTYLLCAVLCSSPAYVLVQPILRYRYLISSLLIMMAFDGAVRFYVYLRQATPFAQAAAARALGPDADA